ncbi:MAG: multidrug effflux MFS transporter [Burkholderiaceae bacterium]
MARPAASATSATPTTLTSSAPRPPHAPLWLLALATLSGTLAMHMFVPALPLAAQDLGASTGAMQMTISVYIFGLAIGQPIYGPLADRWGRRPVLMAGLLLYTVAGVVSGLARDVDTMLVARLLQALGGCAGLVLGRTMVRDTARAQEATRRLALMNLMVTLGPILSPVLGSLISIAWGWRAIFVALTLAGCVTMLCAWRRLPETRGAEAPASAAELSRHYLALLTSPAFLGFALGGACATTSMYAFLSSAPFIFTQELGRPAHEVGLYLALLTSGVWLGSMTTSRVVHRVSARKLMFGANGLGLAAAFVLLVASAVGHLSIGVAVACLILFSFGAGIASPVALMQALGINPQAIGSASGLYGSLQMGVGALCTALAGLGHGTALVAAAVMAGASLIAQGSFWLASHQSRA